jgi:hypothetical protein
MTVVLVSSINNTNTDEVIYKINISWHLTLFLGGGSCGIGGIIVNNVRAFPGLDTVVVEEGKGEDCWVFLIT